jgi:BMFP domain-containing protein YqiC
MMSNPSDFTKIMNSTFSAVTGMVGDVKAEFDEKIMNYLAKMDLVKREEFEVMQEMLKQSRLEQEDLKKRILKLEQNKK